MSLCFEKKCVILQHKKDEIEKNINLTVHNAQNTVHFSPLHPKEEG